MKILHTADWHIGQFKGPVVDGVNLRSQDSSNWNSVCYGGLWHSIGSRHSFCSSCNRSDGSC